MFFLPATKLLIEMLFRSDIAHLSADAISRILLHVFEELLNRRAFSDQAKVSDSKYFWFSQASVKSFTIPSTWSFWATSSGEISRSTVALSW